MKKADIPCFKVVSLITVLAFHSVACVAQKNNKSYYHEDLYGLRPQFGEPVDSLPATSSGHKKGEVHPIYAVNFKVDAVLDSINRFHITRKFIDGFTLQIYSGQNREMAVNSKKKIMAEIPDLNAEVEYHQPKFRVRVGSYFSRLEAQKDLYRLKRSFPNAILVPEKIPIR